MMVEIPLATYIVMAVLAVYASWELTDRLGKWAEPRLQTLVVRQRIAELRREGFPDLADKMEQAMKDDDHA